jgi:hypothetical protein
VSAKLNHRSPQHHLFAKKETHVSITSIVARVVPVIRSLELDLDSGTSGIELLSLIYEI